MTLELFGSILMVLGFLLFVYGYLKASKRIEIEDKGKVDFTAYFLRGTRYDPAADLRRVTEQEKREALAFAAGVRILARLPLHDWEESGEL